MSDTQYLARAKVNLTLHVGRVIRDADRYFGYHPLDSLVVFADFGDRMGVRPADTHSLKVSGPLGEGLEADEDNLATKAVRRAGRMGVETNVAITLEKHIPVSAGLGGGSADAAAVLRALCPDHPDLMEAALSLGADVPACVVSKTLRMTGIGDTVRCVPGLGTVAAVLVNPGVAVSTAAIFREFDAYDPRETPRPQAHDGTLLERAREGRNDLQPVAVALESRIGDLIDGMGTQDGCGLARMTGSGATVFGLFDSDAQAERAASVFAEHGVWARACRLGDTDEP